MRRVSVDLEEELDEALALQAMRLRISKSALIRTFIAASLKDREDAGPDPFAPLIGSVGAAAGSIDATIYGA